MNSPDLSFANNAKILAGPGLLFYFQDFDFIVKCFSVDI